MSHVDPTPENVRHPESPQADAEEDQWRKVLRVKQTTRAIAVAILVVVVVGGAIGLKRIGDNTEAIRDTQQTGSPVLKGLTDLAEQINSCVTPDGKCFHRSQRRTAETVASINVVTRWAAVCGPLVTADQPLREREQIIEDCFADLARLNKTP